MEINTIFVNKLYAFKFDTQVWNEFERAFKLWNDAEYLLAFFENNIQDIHAAFYNGMTLEGAIMNTLAEAREFEHIVLNRVATGTLDYLFKQLDNKFYRQIDISRQKAYGTYQKSWLRIYAIKIGTIYIVTGSAIKLTRTMGERAHTKKELVKMEQCKDFLIQQGIFDEQAIVEM
ncbi:hypothetical protein ACSBL2_05460 [Pedobacter sp. AW31-3R]|uniref:hypothetical protein n=1 Tax=Pedobacter sp. AW31-3R TaxID=3445781 RepID=UPI003FA10053